MECKPTDVNICQKWNSVKCKQTCDWDSMQAMLSEVEPHVGNFCGAGSCEAEGLKRYFCGVGSL